MRSNLLKIHLERYKRENHASRDILRSNCNETEALLCRGRAEVSASGDTEGNASVEGSVSYSRESDNGTKYSAEVRGGVERDREGNVSGKAEVRAGVDWNDR